MIHYADDRVTLHHGDCLDVLRELPDASVDAVVTDPPYGLEFMGKEWDAPWKTAATGRGVRVEAERSDEMTARGKGHSTAAGPYLASRVDSVRVAGLPFQQWCELWAAECLRVLKPGGHMLAFGGTRTWHRLACAVEDVGFEIRDSIAWMYGSGFPKSLDVSKAIDKAAGVEREVVATIPDRWAGKGDVLQRSQQAEAESVNLTAPATPEAAQWKGWGTALKPAFEPVVVARKPLVGTVARNVLEHGTGALNVNGCRIGEVGGTTSSGVPNRLNSIYGDGMGGLKAEPVNEGRWPANVVLDDSQAEQLDQQSGVLTSGANPKRRGFDGERTAYSEFAGQEDANPQRGVDIGGASRFYYTAKAASSERVRDGDTAHPTVKPLSLMRWLVRLVTPPGGVVLEPFAGSGTTVEACIAEGFECVAIERETDYLPLILSRIKRGGKIVYDKPPPVAPDQLDLFGSES